MTAKSTVGPWAARVTGGDDASVRLDRDRPDRERAAEGGADHAACEGRVQASAIGLVPDDRGVTAEIGVAGEHDAPVGLYRHVLAEIGVAADVRRDLAAGAEVGVEGAVVEEAGDGEVVLEAEPDPPRRVGVPRHDDHAVGLHGDCVGHVCTRLGNAVAVDVHAEVDRHDPVVGEGVVELPSGR